MFCGAWGRGCCRMTLGWTSGWIVECLSGRTAGGRDFTGAFAGSTFPTLFVGSIFPMFVSRRKLNFSLSCVDTGRGVAIDWVDKKVVQSILFQPSCSKELQKSIYNLQHSGHSVTHIQWFNLLLTLVMYHALVMKIIMVTCISQTITRQILATIFNSIISIALINHWEIMATHDQQFKVPIPVPIILHDYCVSSE